MHHAGTLHRELMYVSYVSPMTPHMGAGPKFWGPASISCGAGTGPVTPSFGYEPSRFDAGRLARSRKPTAAIAATTPITAQNTNEKISDPAPQPNDSET